MKGLLLVKDLLLKDPLLMKVLLSVLKDLKDLLLKDPLLMKALLLVLKYPIILMKFK